jgi:hypothetical protein
MALRRMIFILLISILCLQSVYTATLVEDFTNYNLYFRNIKHICVTGGTENKTEALFGLNIDRCANVFYRPRYLTTSQVSWKSSPPPKKNDSLKSDSYKNTDGIVSNTSSNSTEIIEEVVVRKEIIHKYLAFALLLPKHPFSTDLLLSLISVGPMYPSVTVVTGGGNDFKEMCSQYDIRSFPQLLFFKDGILKNRYDGVYTPERVAAKFSNWTNSLPKSLPITTANLRISFENRPHGDHFLWAPKTLLFSTTIFGFLIAARVPYSSEPIMGTLDFLIPYDSFIFLLSGVFVITRFIYFLYAKKSIIPTI